MVFGLALSPFYSSAQALLLTGRQPAPLATQVPRASAVALTFSQPLGPNSASAVQVFSQQRGGRLAGTRALSGNSLVFQPQRVFRPGETLWATATAAAQTASGTPLTPQVWQFTAAAVGGTGQLIGNTDIMGPSSPYAIAAADVDDDGDVDLLSANSIGGNVTLFRNDGAAGFAAGGTLAMPTRYSPQSLVVGDLDGDGDLDLVAGAYTSPGAVSGVGMLCVRFNNGSGVFAGTGNLALTQPVHSMGLGDVDGDGDLDLLASLGGTAPAVEVRLNNGLGGFGAPVSLPMQSECLRLCLGDIDGDGDLDLVANMYNGGAASIRFNNGSGGFSGTTGIVTNTYNYALALVDFDRDGDLDLALSSDNFRGIELYANNGQGSFLLFTRLATFGTPTSLTAADLNGDGAPDLLGTGNDKVESFLNNGTGGFGVRMSSSYVYLNPRDLAAADLDNDGDLDVALASTAGNRLSVRLNNGTGAPLAQLSPAAATAPLALSPVPAHPADDAVWVRQLPAGTRVLLVRDALGRAVRTVPVAGADDVALPLAGLLPGLYLVQAGSATARLVVE